MILKSRPTSSFCGESIQKSESRTLFPNMTLDFFLPSWEIWQAWSVRLPAHYIRRRRVSKTAFGGRNRGHFRDIPNPQPPPKSPNILNYNNMSHHSPFCHSFHFNLDGPPCCQDPEQIFGAFPPFGSVLAKERFPVRNMCMTWDSRVFALARIRTDAVLEGPAAQWLRQSQTAGWTDGILQQDQEGTSLRSSTLQNIILSHQNI